MKELFIYTSNRLEKLSEKLAEIVSEPTENPLAPETIVVHSKGMGHWVSMALAEKNGVCANTLFHFPNEFLEKLFQLAGLDTGKSAIFEPDIMTFHLMKILLSCLEQKEFDEIKGYLSDDASGLKLYQLSGKISDMFDQYLTFRPDMVFSWEKGLEEHWQALLWRKMVTGTEKKHRAGLRRAFLERLPVVFKGENEFPRRVSVFGISYLPDFHLEVLAALSDFMQVNLFVLNPCREYWSDIVNEKEIRRIKGKYGKNEFSDEDLFFEKGNPLLSAFGTMGKDFFSRINGLEGIEVELFEQEKEDSVLSLVQSDILNLQDRTNNVDRELLRASDNTGKANQLNIRIHSCHSPMRELEVLHDQLLAMFEADPGLLPKDILVMAPDIETYAPFIHAVFDAQTDQRRKIPFSISDQSMLKDNSMVDGFMALLEVADSRFGCRQVMQLLDAPGVKETFGIREPDISLIEKWINDTNIRWGIDAFHREELGLPAFNDNTWRAGLDRLLLGYAMPGENRYMFAGILPYDDIEGGDAQLLGNFLDFFHRLLKAKKDLVEKRTLKQWSSLLRDLLDGFFISNHHSEMERQVLLRTFDRLSTAFNITGFDQDIDLPVVKGFLQHHLAGESKRGGFLSGGVTFCSMLPLRSIPSKVICLIGMNYDDFPRNRHPLSFDLMAAKPRPGDRIKRNDDKYLFLQALISARKKFYISYVGQSQYDNSQMPPSVVVSDLLDYLMKGFGFSASDIIVRHRLQAFSDGYFGDDANLFSYSREDFDACLAADKRLKNGPVQKVFIQDTVLPPDVGLKTVDLDALSRFFSHPSRYFLQQRLGIYFDDMLWDFNEKEEFELHGLNRYKVEQDLLRSAGEGWDFSRRYAVEQAMGRLPHGNSGKAVFSKLYSDVNGFREKARKYQDRLVTEELPVTLVVGDFTITGNIGEIYESGLVQTACKKIRSRHLMQTWIIHLVLCAAEKNRHVERTVLVGKDWTWLFRRPKDAGALLETLLTLYWDGLGNPLVFFPETSYAYAKHRMNKNSSEDSALQAARIKWAGNAFVPGESDDPYYQLCFPSHQFESVIEGGYFQETSIKLYKPMLDHCRGFEEY